MKKQILDFKNYVLHLVPSEQRKGTAVLLFHGFPSESLNGTDQEKNEDLLKHISESTGYEAYLHHYSGLGKSIKGVFSFSDSINDSKELLKLILSKHKYIILIGHSWGGWVAMNCIRNSNRNIKQLILLSPLNELPYSEILKTVMKDIRNNFPHIMQNKSEADFVNELEELNKTHNPRRCVDHIDPKSRVLILQANEDQEVPQQSTMEFYKLFGENCTYEIMDTDHSFTRNRNDMINKCISFIKEQKEL